MKIHSAFAVNVVAASVVIHAAYGFASNLAFRGSSRYFLDTADVNEWKSLLPSGMFHGVTTNPSILERCNQKCTVPSLRDLAKEALSNYDIEEFMVQAWGTDSDSMYNIGMALSEPDRDRIVIKVPVTREGAEAASRLINSGVRVCFTACYNSKQALIAAGCGVEYIAPYLGRMSDAGKDGINECIKMQEIVNGLGSSTRILVASIRDVDSMALLAGSGLDTFTFSPAVARGMFEEDLTTEAALDFENSALRGGAVTAS